MDMIATMLLGGTTSVLIGEIIKLYWVKNDDD